jgi:hypothetical protein
LRWVGVRKITESSVYLVVFHVDLEKYFSKKNKPDGKGQGCCCHCEELTRRGSEYGNVERAYPIERESVAQTEQWLLGENVAPVLPDLLIH